jgi:hypothetical protein
VAAVAEVRVGSQVGLLSQLAGAPGRLNKRKL